MKTVFNYLTAMILLSLLFSCQSKEEKRKIEVSNKAYDVFYTAILEIKEKDKNGKINTDTLSYRFKQLESANIDSALSYAYKIDEYAKKFSDSIKVSNNRRDSIHFAQKEKEWEKSKAGKIQKKYPYWSKEDCQRLANRELWIGMNIRMVYYLYGEPDKINTSNYGRGNEYQYCWYDWNPGYFYTKEDALVKSYN